MVSTWTLRGLESHKINHQTRNLEAPMFSVSTGLADSNRNLIFKDEINSLALWAHTELGSIPSMNRSLYRTAVSVAKTQSVTFRCGLCGHEEKVREKVLDVKSWLQENRLLKQRTILKTHSRDEC